MNGRRPDPDPLERDALRIGDQGEDLAAPASPISFTPDAGPPRAPAAAATSVPLQTVRDAIAEAWKLRPESRRETCCGHCWGRGRQDAIRAIGDALHLDLEI